MWETIRGYLTFTRKERKGVLFLLLLIGVLFVLPYFFKPSVGDPDPAAYEKMKEGIRHFESRTTDSSQVTEPRPVYPHDAGSANYSANVVRPVLRELFYFDPNLIGSKDWQRLGLNDRQVKTILNYIEKGGHFRKAEDLQKIYGLPSADYKRLAPYVRLPVFREPFETGSGNRRDPFFNSYARKTFNITDINQADSAEWSRLPGIGDRLASRIIRFRNKLGGFYQVEQVGETFGLADSSFQKIRPYLRLNAGSLHYINLNSASKEELQSHPYIGWQIARSIVDYRLQHGNFQSVEELLQLAQMDHSKFEKLKHYVIVL